MKPVGRPKRARAGCGLQSVGLQLVGLSERYGEQSRWAERMLERTEELFEVWQLYKRGWIEQVALQQALIPVRQAMRELLERGVSYPYED